MRARYTSYVTGDVAFLRTSATAAVQAEFDEEASRSWSAAAQWHGLEIIATEKGGAGDDDGVVEFRALYSANGEFCNHHEVSRFVREPDGWKFDDGELVPEKPVVREEPKIGRNDPCPCGSGKKYKKCCGRAE
jgi:SEC-C motif-containing protein